MFIFFSPFFLLTIPFRLLLVLQQRHLGKLGNIAWAITMFSVCSLRCSDKKLVGLGFEGERRQWQPGKIDCWFCPLGFQSSDKPKRAVTKQYFYRDLAKLGVIYPVLAGFLKLLIKYHYIYLTCLTLVLVFSSLLSVFILEQSCPRECSKMVIVYGASIYCSCSKFLLLTSPNVLSFLPCSLYQSLESFISAFIQPIYFLH